MKALVLGSGLVGAAAAADLASDGMEVTVADISEKSLARLAGVQTIHTVKGDLRKREFLDSLLAKTDIVLNAVPGFMGYETLKAAVEAGKNTVDIAFIPEDPMVLDDLAREKNLSVITDCGVAPGMSNILTALGCSMLDECETAMTYVGGLPIVRQWPYNYKAVFSPLDVIEEYTRPARYVENGVLVTRPALSDVELIDFPDIGTLEAFNSDGIRSLAYNIKAKNIKEKTMRYPGHAALMEILRETGFFSKEALDINGSSIRPLDFTARILFPKWELTPGEEDITVMKVFTEGELKGKKLRHSWYLCDRYDTESGVHSMARTTGYTATAAIRMMASGIYSHKGVVCPEFLGTEKKYVNFLLEDLARKGVNYHYTMEEIG